MFGWHNRDGITLLIRNSHNALFLNAYSLRSKYGPPLDRETFTVRPGIEIVADNGPSKQVCRIQLPSGMKIVGTVPVGAVTKQQSDEVLNEVVPSLIRGKELNRIAMATGAPMHFLTVYEHVTISESQIEGVGQGVTVNFKDPACWKQTVP